MCANTNLLVLSEMRQTVTPSPCYGPTRLIYHHHPAPSAGSPNETTVHIVHTLGTFMTMRSRSIHPSRAVRSNLLRGRTRLKNYSMLFSSTAVRRWHRVPPQATVSPNPFRFVGKHIHVYSRPTSMCSKLNSTASRKRACAKAYLSCKWLEVGLCENVGTAVAPDLCAYRGGTVTPRRGRR